MTMLIAVPSVPQTPEPKQTRITRLKVKLRQLRCGLSSQGHTTYMHFEPQRVTLRCSTCGHESPGLDVGRSRVKGSPKARKVS